MPKGALLLLSSLTLLTSLTAQSLVNSDARAMGNPWMDYQPQVEVQTRCPPRVPYSVEDVKKMGTELDGLLKKDPSAVTPRVARDYRTLRQRCDAYEKK